MHARNGVIVLGFAFATALAGVSGVASAATGRLQASAPRVADQRVGWSVVRPAGWKVQDLVLSTEFSAGARCRSVVIVDFEAPAAGGQAGPGLERSLVQVCARRAADGLSLVGWLRRTYRDRFETLFEPARFGRCTGYRTGSLDETTTGFLQTPGYRLQIVTEVQARPALLARRQAQVRRVVESLTLKR